MTDDRTARLTTALEGRYTIERQLGEGGMATVYLAEDLKHNRKVALKLLKPELAAVVGAERFLAEIQVTANLQHPHILPLFDSGEADGFLFYVMPFVEGETLAERLARERQLPVDEAVRFTTQVAMALQTAHEQGVVHRDIKPANILLSRGEPLVADFGIALAVGAAGGARLTETGLSVGTPYYMSPEQATGDQAVGPATDVYALGCVAYEMLIGEPPYIGNTAQAVLGKILAEKPRSPTVVRASVPLNVEGAVLKALEKLPADRFTSADEFARALGDPAFRHGHSLAADMAAGPATGWTRTTTGVATLAGVIGLALIGSLLRPVPGPPLVQMRIALPVSQRIIASPFGSSMTISADGSTLVYHGPGATSAGALWVRRFDDLNAEPLRGGETGFSAVISPDGSMVAFVPGNGATDGDLSVVPLRGGPPRTITGEVRPSGVDWGTDGMIYYQNFDRGLSRIPADGGPPEAVTVLDAERSEQNHRFPDVLPNGEGAIFTIQYGADVDLYEIAVVSFATGEITVLTRGTAARYTSAGYLIWATGGGTLTAARFDAKRLELSNQAVAVVEGVGVNQFGAIDMTLSESGALVYRIDTGNEVEPVWVDRSGNFQSVDPEWSFDDVAFFQGVPISPDGTRMAVVITGEGSTDVWIKQLDRGPLSRLTFEGSINYRPAWTPDGQFVTFLSDRGSDGDLWIKRADGTGPAELLMDHELRVDEGFVSGDASWMVFRTGSGGNRDIRAARLDGDTAVVPLVVTEFEELSPALSPDSRWLAYVSNETGFDEIYVRPFPDAGTAKWQVSPNGGTEPVWAHSGRELFYKSRAEELIAVEITPGPTFSTGNQDVLFPLGGFASEINHPKYDVHPSDSLFIMLRKVQTATADVIWVQNWFAELKRVVGN